MTLSISKTDHRKNYLAFY